VILDSQVNVSCNGGNDGQVSITIFGGQSPYTIDQPTTGLTSGNYIFVISDINGCQSSLNAQILQPSTSLSVTVAVHNDVSCNGLADGSVLLTISGGTAPYTTTPNTTNLSAGMHVFTTTDYNGCSAQTSVIINEPSPISTSTAIQDVLCPNGTGSIDLTISGGQGPYVVLWDNTVYSEDLQNIPIGLYNAEITDDNGCNVALTAIVNQTLANQPIVTNNTGTTELTCLTQSITYTVSAVSSFQLTGGGTVNGNTATFTSPGQYVLSVNDANSCPSQFVINITQDITPPTVSISNNSSSTELNCTNSQISVQASGALGYVWNNGLSNNASQVLTQAGNYTVIGTALNGCSSISAITITSDFTQPTAGIVNNSTGTVLNCNLTQISLTASGGGTYSWNNNLGANNNVNINSPGTYTLTVTGSNGCQDTESISITQSATPTVSVNPPINICSGSSGILTAVGSPAGGSYSWSCSSATTSSITLTPATNGVCQVIYYDAFNCPSNTAITTYTVFQTPLVNVNGTATICSGNTASITAVASLPGGTYSWSPTATPTATISVSPNQTTTYNVTYTLNGCSSAPVGHTVNVNDSPLVTSNNVGICNGEAATLTASTNIPGGLYSWNTIPIQSNSSITVQPSATTSYTVTYTAPNNCPGSSTSIVTVTDIPSVQLDDIVVCEGQTATLIAIPSVPGGSFIWSPGGIGASILEVSPSTSTQYSVIYSLNNCSSPADNAIVTVINTPTVAVQDQVICLGQSATLTATGSPAGGTYEWSTA
jgi:hypothetical protein